MSYTFRNAICAVPTLAAGDLGYARAGFSVRPGGKHTIGTQNSIVHLDNGYFELVSIYDRTGASSSPRRKAIMDFIDREAGGLIGFTLRTDSMSDDIERLADLGLCYGGPVGAERTTADGTVYSWRVMRPVPQPCPALLPVLISGDDPPADITGNPNTVNGVKAVAIAAADPTQMIADYSVLLDTPPVDEYARPDLGAYSTAFDVSGFRIEVLRRDGDGPLDRILTHYGSRPVEIHVTAANLSSAAASFGLQARNGQIIVPPILGVGLRMVISDV